MLSHFSHVCLFVTPWTVAHQAPLYMGFSRQEYGNGLPFFPPGNLPYLGIDPVSLKSHALTGRFFTTSTLYYDYISFLAKFPLSLELIIALARGLGTVLVCLSFYQLNHWQSPFQFVKWVSQGAGKVRNLPLPQLTHILHLLVAPWLSSATSPLHPPEKSLCLSQVSEPDPCLIQALAWSVSSSSLDKILLLMEYISSSFLGKKSAFKVHYLGSFAWKHLYSILTIEY